MNQQLTISGVVDRRSNWVLSRSTPEMARLFIRIGVKGCFSSTSDYFLVAAKKEDERHGKMETV